GTGDNPGDGGRNNVVTTGEVFGTGGGRGYLTIMRFQPSTIYVHVGDTVDFTNEDPTEPHTFTFQPDGFPAADLDANGDLVAGIGVNGTTSNGVKLTLPAIDPVDGDKDLHGALPNTITNLAGFCTPANTVPGPCVNGFSTGTLGPTN